MIPAGLVFAGALADQLGAAGLAFDALLLAVPAASLATLGCLGELVDGAAVRIQAVLSTAALALIVLGAAARAPAVTQGIVPRAAHTALVGCLVVFFLQAVASLVDEVRRRGEARSSVSSFS
jgi:hypothetical protein